jgi:gliding motility-associated-like protein
MLSLWQNPIYVSNTSLMKKNLLKKFLIFLVLTCSTMLAFGQTPPPVITSFTPVSGLTDGTTTVTITGSGFNTDKTKNLVLFGAVAAVVTNATANSLTVTAPAGATYAPITVLNRDVNLIGSSTAFFTPTFTPNKGTIAAGDFEPKVDFTAGANPTSIAIGDLDSDGKPDLVVTNTNSNTITIFRNISSSGSITATSFATGVSFSVGAQPYSVAIGDLDGDGKPDLAVSNYGSLTISVLHNTSTSGSINTSSFAAKLDFSTGQEPFGVSIGDVDGDGKSEMVVSNIGNNTISIFRNTSSVGSIDASSFAARQNFAVNDVPNGTAIGDLDGDGKPDIVVAHYGSNPTVSVFRNISSSGSINLSAKVDFALGSGPQTVVIGDIDGDGKPDLATANQNSNNISVLRNTATSGSIDASSFAAKVDFGTNASPQTIAIGDLDGDGKPDLATVSYNSNTVSILRNTASSGIINASSFASKVDYPTGGSPFGVAIGDLDGDGMADIAVGSATVSVLRNNPHIAPVLTASSGTAASIAGGNVASTPVAVDPGITATIAFGPVSLSSATVSISGNFAEDLLAFNNTGAATFGNITASLYSAGVLTLSSTGNSATLAQWQAALRAVTYTNNALTPNTANRTISFTLTNVPNASNTATRTLTVTAAVQATLVMADAALKVGETSLLTITFSEAVTGFSNADLSIVNGTLTAVSSSDGGITWTATFTPTAAITDATNVITLDNTGVINGAGNAGLGTTASNNYAIDTQQPTATLVMADAALKVGETSLLTITFSEAVIGFTNADLNFTNGTLSAISSSDGGITWTATFTPAVATTTTDNLITLDNTGVADAAGNIGTGTTPSNVYDIDTKAPTVVSVLRASPNPTMASNVDYTVTFSEVVSGLDATDFTITVAGGMTGTVNTITTTDSKVYNVNVHQITGFGRLRLSVKAGLGITDAAGNGIPTPFQGEIYDIQLIPVVTHGGVALTAMPATYGTPSNAQSFTVSGTTLSANLIVTPPADFEISSDGGNTYGSVASYPQTGGVVTNQVIFVRLKATAAIGPHTGNITITSTGATTDNVSIPVSTVSTAPLTITATGPAKAFGSALTAGISNTNFTASTTYNNEVVGSVTLTPDAAGLSAATPGGTAYMVTPSAATGTAGFIASNYNITYVPFNGTVGAINQTITFGPLTAATYGNAPITLTGTSTSSLPVTYTSSDPTVATVNGSTLTIVGAGTTTITAQQAGNNNFTAGTNVLQLFTVGAKSIIVTADAKSKTYGAADPALTYAITTGTLVGTDAFTGALTRATGETVNTYAISQGNLALNANYALTFVPANFIITTKVLTVTANNQSKVYGSANPALTLAYSGFSGTDNASALSTLPTLTTTAVTNSPVTTYPITVGGGVSANYSFVYQPGTLSVTPAALTITADNKTKNYLAANPALTASYAGFVLGETATVLTTPVSLSTTATAASLAGNYAITPSGAVAANYSISYAPGTLTVSATAQNITFVALANKLSTDAIFTLTATASSGLAVTYTSSDPTVARIVNGNQIEILQAGITNITASQAGSTNYAAATPVVQSFTVIDNPAPIITIVSNKGNSISKGETALLTASGAVTYQWSNSSGIIGGQNSATLSVRPSVNTTYTVTGFNQFGRSSTQSFNLEVRSDFQALNISNVVTPNGDGKNDFWIIENIDLYPNNKVKVFDRAGKSVFQQDGYKNTWSGTYNGSPLPEATYYYLIDFGPGFGVKKGTLSIIGN